MKSEQFIEIVNRQCQQCLDILDIKNLEYATDIDRLHNFNVASTMQQITEEQALAGMWAKHIVSINDMIHSGKTYTRERWEEKITDAINYLLLLRALIEQTGRAS
jgi:hypothetical protein